MTDDEDATALRGLQERFQALLEQAPIGVFIVTPSLRIHYFNARLVDVLATTALRLPGLDLGALPDQRPVDALRCALGGEPGSYEGPYDLAAEPVASAPVVTLHVHPLRDESSGTVIGAVGFADDISARVRALEALERSEARFRVISERSRDAIAVYRDGCFIFANPAMVEILRYDKPSQVIGKPMLDIIHPDDRALVMKRRESFEQGKPLPPTELRFLRRDGSFGYMEFVSAPIDYDGPAILSIVRDVTEVRLMQADLLQSDRMASVGTLAAGVAHEINNPLAYMNTNLEGIQNRKLPELRSRIERMAPSSGPSPLAVVDEIEAMVRLAREGAEHVRTIVADLKTFSRADDAPRSWVDLHRVLDAAIHMASSGLPRSVTTTKRYMDTPPIYGNESRLAQVFLNILMNAAQAVAGRDDAVIEIDATTDTEGRAVVTVRDNGRGMTADVVGRIFDPFFTTKQAGLGTGLGLWVCAGIVRSFGGRIDVESAPDQGTSFTVLLPASVEPAR